MSAPRRTPRRHVDGVLLLDKPQGITSNAALMRVKRLYRAEKAGHTGTLDPLASGLLPVCFGAATRFAGFLLDAPKRYVATVRFGVTTTTLDAEGAVVASRELAFGHDDLDAALARFTGPQMQTPPAHSALKFEGRPYYDYARLGIDIARAPRPVVIHALRLLQWQAPDAVVEVECSKGTYVRVLAADVGEALGCGAHLAALRRTASGGFALADAVTFDALDAMDECALDACLKPVDVLVAHLPALTVTGDAARRFRHGGAVPAGDCGDGLVAAYEADALLGIADVTRGIANPRRTIASPAARPELLEKQAFSTL
ncbi:MAG TPA: tRNA pseudouridine(55) synthase TruB [Casimicrobiaceae bacterium]|nr:tRNA pseudouridine(55) synthase TruB [Casimicrobiaceae bacterium]